MANATAPEPVETEAKKPSRQPPSDSVWVRYHPWMEGAMGHLASWSIHLLIIGVAVLVSLAYAWGFIKHNHQLPVEPVQLAADAGGGGGSNEGSGDGPGGDHAPPNEGVKSDKTNEGNTEKPADRVKLTEAERQKTAQEFPAADGQNTQRGPESMNTFHDLDMDLSDKLRDGITPAKGSGGTANGNGGTANGNGNGGTGKDGGMGSGKDKGVGSGNGEDTGRMLNEHEKRQAALENKTSPMSIRPIICINLTRSVPSWSYPSAPISSKSSATCPSRIRSCWTRTRLRSRASGGT